MLTLELSTSYGYCHWIGNQHLGIWTGFYCQQLVSYITEFMDATNLETLALYVEPVLINCIFTQNFR